MSRSVRERDDRHSSSHSPEVEAKGPKWPPKPSHSLSSSLARSSGMDSAGLGAGVVSSLPGTTLCPPGDGVGGGVREQTWDPGGPGGGVRDEEQEGYGGGGVCDGTRWGGVVTLLTLAEGNRKW